METNYFDYIKEHVFKEDFDAYLASLENPLTKGIVINPNMLDHSNLIQNTNLNLKQSHIATDSYEVLNDKFHASDYALYHAGAFYSQEISAGSAVEVLNPQKGDIVLDACAAPGGKSAQIAGRIGNSGLVISNEKDKMRASILANNCIDQGIEQSIVINADATQLSKYLPSIFDRILVDAPCSGEGMIKKEKDAVLQQWSIEYVTKIAQLQLDILNDVASLLKKDGVLVYSTCTFNTIENEGVVLRFLQQHPEFMLDNIDVTWGRSGFALDGNHELTKCRRILPMDHGEGHFIARFIKKEGSNATVKYLKNEKLTKQELNYVNQALGTSFDYYYHFNDGLIASSRPMIELKGVKLVKYYTYIGDFAIKRFEPSFALSRCNSLTTTIASIDISLQEANNWLKGNPIEHSTKGWVIVTYKGCPLSFGKGDGRTIKNKYPKAKRISFDVI